MTLETILWLGEDYTDYTASYYQQDLFRTFADKYTVAPYGEGFGDYDESDDIHDILAKVKIEPDLIVVSNTWGNGDGNIPAYSSHTDIELDRVDTPSLMFLNKEYSKIDRKLEFIKENSIEYVTSVLKHRCAEWEDVTGATFIWEPFGVNLDRFFYDPAIGDSYDFGFSGNLHEKWLEERKEVKEHLFKPRYVDFSWWHNLVHTRRFKERFDELDIYWGEFQNRSLLLGSRAPFGEDYVELLNKCKTFFNTRSALGILNTRFWELMATKTLVICPDDDYYGLLENGVNCVTYESLTEFEELLHHYATNDAERREIVENARKFVEQFTWENVVEDLVNQIEPV